MAISSRTVTWNGCAYGNGIYVAVGSGYSEGTSNSRLVIGYSSDGKNWEESQITLLDQENQIKCDLSDVTFFKNEFYLTAVDLSSSRKRYVYSSNNGKNWNQISKLPYDNSMSSNCYIKYLKDKFFVFYGLDKTLKYSNDAINWNSKIFKNYVEGISYDIKNDVFLVLTSDNSLHILNSSLTSETKTIQFEETLLDIEFDDNGRLVLLSERKVYYSDDYGETFKEGKIDSSYESSFYPQKIRYNNGTFVLFYRENNQLKSSSFLKSENGENWESEKITKNVRINSFIII